MLAFGHRLRRLTALTEVCQPAVFATVGSTASFVPDFGYAPFMRGLRPPFTISPPAFLAERTALVNSAYRADSHQPADLQQCTPDRTTDRLSELGNITRSTGTWPASALLRHGSKTTVFAPQLNRNGCSLLLRVTDADGSG